MIFTFYKGVHSERSIFGFWRVANIITPFFISTKEKKNLLKKKEKKLVNGGLGLVSTNTVRLAAPIPIGSRTDARNPIRNPKRLGSSYFTSLPIV